VTLALGLPLALLFAGLLIWIVYRLLKGTQPAAWIASGAYLAAALSNNMLSVKTPTVAIFFVLLIAFAIPRQRSDNLPAPSA
jgi:O-antigen ligase